MIAKNKYAQLALNFCSSIMNVMIEICFSATVLTPLDKCVLPYSKTFNALCNISIDYINIAYAIGRAEKVGGINICMGWMQRSKNGRQEAMQAFLQSRLWTIKPVSCDFFLQEIA